MRIGLGIPAAVLSCVAAALTVAACDDVAPETARLPADIELPVFEAAESDTDAENLSVAVEAADSGQCRVYFDNESLVTSNELYDLAFNHLDGVVQAAGGPEELVSDPEKIPVVHIWGDVDTPWRCIAGAIYNVRAAGYPTVGFVSTPTETDGPPVVTHAAYVDLPVPDPQRAEARIKNKIELTSANEILWNGTPIDTRLLAANLKAVEGFGVVPELQFEPAADVRYEFAAKVLDIVSTSQANEVNFVGSEQHRTFGKAK